MQRMIGKFTKIRPDVSTRISPLVRQRIHISLNKVLNITEFPTVTIRGRIWCSQWTLKIVKSHRSRIETIRKYWENYDLSIPSQKKIHPLTSTETDRQKLSACAAPKSFPGLSSGMIPRRRWVHRDFDPRVIDEGKNFFCRQTPSQACINTYMFSCWKTYLTYHLNEMWEVYLIDHAIYLMSAPRFFDRHGSLQQRHLNPSELALALTTCSWLEM
jgi:hypothetical protein